MTDFFKTSNVICIAISFCQFDPNQSMLSKSHFLWRAFYWVYLVQERFLASYSSSLTIYKTIHENKKNIQHGFWNLPTKTRQVDGWTKDLINGHDRESEKQLKYAQFCHLLKGRYSMAVTDHISTTMRSPSVQKYHFRALL